MDLTNQNTHETLPERCKDLGLPPPGGAGSKRERMRASFDALPDDALPGLAERILLAHLPSAKRRNAIQDMLWEDGPTLAIPRRARREIAQAMQVEDLYIDARRFDALLESLWVLEDEAGWFPHGNDPHSLRNEIQRHIHHNPGDWEVEDLFDRLGAYDCSEPRFARFLEGLAGPTVRPNEPAQRRFVTAVNEVLSRCGLEMRETGEDGGYPTFTLISRHSAGTRSPKNIIFASSVKPDLRFSSAIDNDIEIVTNADKVLVYDKMIGPDGVRWGDLQAWWADARGITDSREAKKSLYARLLDSLPMDSPPQTLFFEAFFRSFRTAVPSLPALLPEVWLHWDPKTVKERGAEALTRFRMDFLLLLPNGVRVVVEVDGQLHYAGTSGVADPKRYARMVAADRDLKLAGYEVYRFGGYELQAGTGDRIVEEFFVALFSRHGVPIEAGPAKL